LNGRSPIAFPYTSCPERRAIDVYVYAASQPVRQRKLAKAFTTIFHLISSLSLAAKHIVTPADASISHPRSTETAK
jgi:hypothetical protein